MVFPEVLTVQEVSEILRVSDYSVREMLKLGHIKGGFKVGSKWRIPRASVDEVIDKEKQDEVPD